jgi:predicted ATPase
MLRGDARASLPIALAFNDFCLARGVEQFRGAGAAIAAWARARLEGGDLRLEEFRQAVAALAELGHRVYLPFYLGRLAELELAGKNWDAAFARIHSAQELTQDLGQRVFDSFLKRVLGEALLARNGGNEREAEEAFLESIDIAGRQGARGFCLQSALALAKLYQSSGRPIEAHAVLAPALEGFTPTPEMPEIAEAQALLAALQDIDEVRAEVVRRRRMTRLQAAYGAALISARGYGAAETRQAFARARQSAAGDRDARERLAADYGLWAGNYVRGELPAMRMGAAAFMHDVEARPDSPEAGIAHRVQGMTHYFAGEFIEAMRELEQALALLEPGRDDDLAIRFPPDPGAAAMIYLAFASWAVGEAGRAVSFVERMRERVAELSHAPTLAHGSALTAFFALMQGGSPRARTSVSDLARAVHDHDLPLFRAIRDFLVGWATFDDGALADGLEAMRRGAESIGRQNAVVFDGIIKIALAQAEARAGDPERALAVLDEALATCDRTDYRAFECEIHRARGKLLLERDPADLPPAEDAFQTAIALAKRQGARGYQLLAALSLAKLYQSTNRPAEAGAVLAPALEGFAPTPEMPEIAEAMSLSARLA